MMQREESPYTTINFEATAAGRTTRFGQSYYREHLDDALIDRVVRNIAGGLGLHNHLTHYTITLVDEQGAPAAQIAGHLPRF